MDGHRLPVVLFEALRSKSDSSFWMSWLHKLLFTFNLNNVWEFVVHNSGIIDLVLIKQNLIQHSKKLDYDAINISLNHSYYINYVMTPNIHYYYYYAKIPISHLRLLFSLRSDSRTVPTKHGSIKFDPDSNCHHCNRNLPFTIYHLLYECPCFLAQQNKYLTDVPHMPPNSFYSLFINIPRNQIFKLYQFFSKSKFMMLHFFPGDDC